MNDSERQNKQHIHFGHFGLVLLVALLLIGITWMKDPQLFSFHQSSSAQLSQASESSYPDTSILNEPIPSPIGLVAGASTGTPAPDLGPSILQEDGSVLAVGDMGQVLGASTKDVPLSLEQIKIQTIPDSLDGVKQYFSQAQDVEANYLDNAEFESALTSSDQTQIDAQVAKIKKIVAGLQAIAVPASAEKLQQLRILQYNAAIVMLSNFSNADNNAEVVSQALEIFMQSQQEIQQEVTAIQQKFNLSA